MERVDCIWSCCFDVVIGGKYSQREGVLQKYIVQILTLFGGNQMTTEREKEE